MKFILQKMPRLCGQKASIYTVLIVEENETLFDKFLYLSMTSVTKNTNLLDQLLDSVTPEEQHRTDNRMLIAAKLADALHEKNITQTQLAQMLGKHHSVITKWLSGTHNFTIDTLSDIENALGINLIQLIDNQPIIVEFTNC